MKRLLLPLLAALALPTAVNDESYDAGVAKIQWPKMKNWLITHTVLWKLET